MSLQEIEKNIAYVLSPNSKPSVSKKISTTLPSLIHKFGSVEPLRRLIHSDIYLAQLTAASTLDLVGPPLCCEIGQDIFILAENEDPIIRKYAESVIGHCNIL